jgi:hypothetical protein
MARDGGLSKWRVGSRSPAAWSAREIELQALATLAALAQISTPSAAHFLKSHQLLVQKFAADRNRQKRLRLQSVRARSPAAWSAREIELQALATLAALAQISTPSGRTHSPPTCLEIAGLFCRRLAHVCALALAAGLTVIVGSGDFGARGSLARG